MRILSVVLSLWALNVPSILEAVRSFERGFGVVFREMSHRVASSGFLERSMPFDTRMPETLKKTPPAGAAQVRTFNVSPFWGDGEGNPPGGMSPGIHPEMKKLCDRLNMNYWNRRELRAYIMALGDEALAAEEVWAESVRALAIKMREDGVPEARIEAYLSILQSPVSPSEDGRVHKDSWSDTEQKFTQEPQQQ